MPTKTEIRALLDNVLEQQGVDVTPDVDDVVRAALDALVKAGVADPDREPDEVVLTDSNLYAVRDRAFSAVQRGRRVVVTFA